MKEMVQLMWQKTMLHEERELILENKVVKNKDLGNCELSAV